MVEIKKVWIRTIEACQKENDIDKPTIKY